MKRISIVICVLVLSACASGGVGTKLTGSSFSFLNSYDMALKDFEAGRVMEARARVLAMDVSREDYKKAQRLLKKKIDPARIRLLRHYKAKGKKAEKSKRWAKAMQFYLQAAEFSAKPEIFRTKAGNMDLRMRQKRMNALLKQRRLEDKYWLVWSLAYKPPLGVESHDVAYARMRAAIQEDLEDRANRAYGEARRYLRKGMPGMAYVEIESHLRLMKKSEKGKKTMQEVRDIMPKGLMPKGLKRSRMVKKSAQENKKVSKSDVLALIKKGQWTWAKHAALVYLQNEGKGADSLLQDIDTGMKKAASELFVKGSAAFRVEHIDKAVQFWDQAVSLQPDNSEYVDALRRAMQLQERLHLLRSDK